MKNQQGYIKIVLVVFAVIIGLMIFPLKFPEKIQEESKGSEHYCRDLINDPNAKTFEGPSYTASEIQIDNKRQYKLIKEKVPIYVAFYHDISHEHFFSSYKEPYTDSSGQKFIVRIPKGDQGHSYPARSELGDSYLQFAEHGLIYHFYSADGENPEIIGQVDLGPTAVSGRNGIIDVAQVDIYKAVDLPPLPEWVLQCIDMDLSPESESSAQAGGLVIPRQEVSQTKEQLQLEWFLFGEQDFQMRAWWVPHCKPAVYLYPERKQLVNVKVTPRGELSYTDPVYDPLRGWTVNANPSGTLFDINNRSIINNYLYYESKIRDEEIKKPNQGWVIAKSEMESLFDRVLPQLGLNPREEKDFSDYWLKALPESPYYFVGLVEKEQRDYLERLDVTPKPDTSIRFSFFFEPLDAPVSVEAPRIITPQRNGFTLVDWGGMIKLHKDTPFTCSQ